MTQKNQRHKNFNFLKIFHRIWDTPFLQLYAKDSKTGEHQVWSFSDDARAAIPLPDDEEDAEPSVVGAVWNYNSKLTAVIGEKAINAPQLLVLSSLGVLVAFQYYNFLPDYPNLAQLLDTVPGGARESLPGENIMTKQRVSIPKPLTRTSSVMPGTKPDLSFNPQARVYGLTYFKCRAAGVFDVMTLFLKGSNFATKFDPINDFCI